MSNFNKIILEPYIGKELTFVCKNFNIVSKIKEIKDNILVIEDNKGIGLLPLAEILYVQIKNKIEQSKKEIII